MNRPDILVCARTDHARLHYVFERILGPRLGLRVGFTSATDAFNAWEGPCIAYGFQPERPCFHIPAATCGGIFLNKEHVPEVSTNHSLPSLFPALGAGPIPFDLPAAVFWMLARVEEYSTGPRDHYGRFPGKKSLAHRANFLETPIVDRWIELVAKELKIAYPRIDVPAPQAKHQPSYDIDFAWRYLHKPLAAQCKSLVGDLLREGPATFLRGLHVLYGRASDPYDLYDRWRSENAILFFPVGDKSPMDKNHSSSNPAYRLLIRSWHDLGQGGLHPSFKSSEECSRLEQEVERYTLICGEPPIRSRQHFLRLQLPTTLRQLEAMGIREEWSMGYADLPGFRAGTAHPYPWYDLEQERCTELMIHPFHAMDATLRHYLDLTPEEAANRIKVLWEAIQPTGGLLTTLWHNNSVACVDHVWKGWSGLPHVDATT